MRFSLSMDPPHGSNLMWLDCSGCLPCRYGGFSDGQTNDKNFGMVDSVEPPHGTLYYTITHACEGRAQARALLYIWDRSSYCTPGIAPRELPYIRSSGRGATVYLHCPAHARLSRLHVSATTCAHCQPTPRAVSRRPFSAPILICRNNDRSACSCFQQRCGQIRRPHLDLPE